VCILAPRRPRCRNAGAGGRRLRADTSVPPQHRYLPIEASAGVERVRQLWPVLIAEGAAPAVRTMAPGWGRLLSLTASRPHVDLDKAEIRCGRRAM